MPAGTRPNRRLAAAAASLLVFACAATRLPAQGNAAPTPAAPAAAAPTTPPPAAPSPTASATPAPATPPPPPSPTPTPTPAPTPLTQNAIIDSLSPGELQEAINLLRANYIRPADVDERALGRATISGLLTRLDDGAKLLPKPGIPGSAPAVESVPDGFYTEVLGERNGYVRLGALSNDHLGSLDKALKSFNDRGLPAVILDLRGTPAGSNYDQASEVIRRFVAKGKPLFTLRKPSINQERLLTSNGDPSYTGLVLLLVDDDTAGAAETIAAVVRYYNRALVVGENTAGQGVEYADLGLAGGSILRVAISQVMLPGNLNLFPNGVKPDVVVPLSRADKIAIFKTSAEKGLGPFVNDVERPHLNEAALVNGTTPDLDAAREAQAARRRGGPAPKPPIRDVVVQHAMDLVATISVYDPGKPPGN